MDAVKALNRLIHDGARVLMEKEKNSFRLPEEESNYEFIVNNCPNDTMVIKCDDKFPQPGDLFKGEKGECKRADYIIISSEKKVVIIMELKRSTKSTGTRDAIAAKMKGAKCIIDYCESIISSFWGDRDVFKGYKKKYFLCTLNTQKRPFNDGTIPIKNDSPDKFTKLSGKTVLFNKLIV